MHLTGLDLLLWAVTFAAHVVLLLVLWLRQRIRTFPFFSIFIASNVARTIVLFFVMHYGSKRTYFNTYWRLAILDMLLQLGIVYELYTLIFRPLGNWEKNVRRSFLGLVTVSLIIAGVLTLLATPHTRLWMQTVMIRGNFFSAALMSDLFVAMIVLSVTMDLPWTTHAAKIAEGLGFYSVVGVVIETIQSDFGLGRDTTLYTDLSHVRIFIYVGCVLFWTVALYRNAPGPHELPDQMRRQISLVYARMERELEELRLRKTP
jgi:hypothetical protein